ncbi:MAG: hypothetical protein J7L43_00755 [Candidatus Aenigmarchaeota archaeon]|nr:hypothetical protein [Candidatus Aenigmarchaeota archaeon]
MRRPGRPPGPDLNKVAIILKVLVEHPEGLWLRAVARGAGVNPMTVSNYANTILRPFLEDVSLGDEKPILRVLKLRPWALERIEKGASLNELLRFSKILKSVGRRE